MKDIRDKIVLITGGASGIGRIMAFLFAEKKARVIVWDINRAAIKNLEDEGREKGLFIRGMICDVSDREAVYAQAEKLVLSFGPVDIVINNAGIVSGRAAKDADGASGAAGPFFLNTSDDMISKTISVNVFSLFWICKAFLPSMLERDSGHIVTISSAGGIIGVKGLADYCAGKFAAFGFDESLRMELRRMKSAVITTVVCPFFIDTGMFLGVKTRFPLFLPILKSGDTARKIVSAVLKNKRRLLMPPFVYAVYLLRLLPVGFHDWAADFFGISSSMDDFTGRVPGEGKI